jgi:predicted O-methyltransferase YrrM
VPAENLATALRSVDDVAGWMTDAQAGRLWDAAAALTPPARIVEIGSFQGRSTIVRASAAPAGVEVVAIDPHAGNDRGPQELEGFEDAAAGDHEAFLANLDRAGVRDRVRHIRAFSHEALAEVEGPIDVLYIDGAHRFGPALDDVRRWGARVADGGTLLIHDSFSSVGVTLAILTALLLDRRFRFEGRAGSLAVYRREPAPVVANAAHQLAQLPWFVRNVVIKALILAHLTPLTRLLGHRTGDWPY